MADIYISKTLKKPRNLAQADGSGVTSVKISSSATEVTTGANRVYRWNPERMEILGKKFLIEIIISRAWTYFTTKDPELKAYDWKKVRNLFRVKGMLTGTSWNDVAKRMYFMLMIFEDGGAFEFKWHDDTFNVNALDYQFYNEKREGVFTIHFTVDLIRLEAGTGV